MRLASGLQARCLGVSKSTHRMQGLLVLGRDWGRAWRSNYTGGQRSRHILGSSS